MQACVCEEIAKTEQRIQVTTEKKKFGKVITIISGFQGVDLKNISKNLKHVLACGGTIRNGKVELQGDHILKVKDSLVKLGFSQDSIEIA